MSCCMKRRKEQVAKIIDRRNFEAETITIVKELKNIDFSSVDKSNLFDYHQRCHKTYKKAMSYKPPNIKFVNQIIETHTRIAKEMSKRGVKHDTYIERL